MSKRRKRDSGIPSKGKSATENEDRQRPETPESSSPRNVQSTSSAARLDTRGTESDSAPISKAPAVPKSGETGAGSSQKPSKTIADPSVLTGKTESATEKAVAAKPPPSVPVSQPASGAGKSGAPATPTSRAPVPEAKPKQPPVAPVVAPPISEETIIKQVPELKEPEPEPEETAETGFLPTPEPPPRPSVPSMFVLMISPEMAPVAKVGGLGDVVFGLSRELEIRGNAVEIILPKYDCMRYDHIWGLTRVYENLWVPWYSGAINTSVWFGFVHGRKCFFIEPHSQDNFFNRGCYYGNNDDVLRFVFFCRAALEYMWKSGKNPEIIHCHDWQTGIVPVLMYEMYQRLGMHHPRVCFTVHNFRHQGVTGEHVLRATGLHRPEHFFHYDRMRDNHNPHALNLMKSGIVYSNFVTTVSPRHAWEAKDDGQAHGLEHTLHTHQYKYGGVLNGLDYDAWNPEKDPYIPVHYSVQTIEKKYENKRALRNRFWLADNAKPIVGFVGRLDPQKGLDLVRHAIFHSLNKGAQFVLLGNSPEKGINDHFWGLKHHLNNSPDCHLEIGYNEELAHLIYAGADMLVVPSRYEPCGLTQLIALRYGTVPIVRAVGGLVDTVFDKDFANRPLHERNGYVFEHADNAGMESGLDRAIGCYYSFPDHWRHLMINGMRSDYSWNQPGQDYLNIYEHIRDK